MATRKKAEPSHGGAKKPAPASVETAAKKSQVGRPTKFDPSYCVKAKKLCLLGARNVDIAKFFEISTGTLDTWCKAHPEFLSAIKAGREEADTNVANSLYRRALGFKHRAVKIMQYEGQPVIVPYIEKYPADPASMIFWLKNRRPDLWREKVEVEHSTSIAETLKKRRERARKNAAG